MTSAPDSSRLRGLPGLPGGPTFGRSSESGERPRIDFEVDRMAPGLHKIRQPTHDEIAKRRARAALDDMVFDAGGQRRLARDAVVSEKTVRDWIEYEQRVPPLHLAFRVPDHLALIVVSHLIRRWGARALRELRALCDDALRESDDGRVSRAM